MSSSDLRQSIVSTGIERSDAGGLAVGAECDLLDPRLRGLQARLAMLPEAVALLVELDRLVERSLAPLQQPNDLFEPRKRRFEAQFTLLLFGLLCMGGFAQSVSTRVNGSVKDIQGAVVSGVTVTLTDAATARSVTTITNEEGYFLFPDVRPGHYQVTAEAAGFRSSG